MKRILVLISVFFWFFSYNVNAIYSGSEIYNKAERSFAWANENIAPLGNTDSIASDYCVIALKRAGKTFDFKKYANITKSKTPLTVQDAHRIIMTNTAAGGKLSESYIAANTYNNTYLSTQDIATSLLAIFSGEYEVKSDIINTNILTVQLLEKQNADGSFDSDVLTTAKCMLALSFMSGKCYVVKGENIGEKYEYDVNAALLRGANYLQNKKESDFGFGSTTKTAFVIMALDAVGIDADNDPGFTDGEKSTISALFKNCAEDGSFENDKDSTAIALCAMVSHLRAMQGNSPFFALRTEDMPYNPNDYVEDFNYSGEGLAIETQDKIQLSVSEIKIQPDLTATPHAITTPVPTEYEPCISGRKEQGRLNVITIIIIIAVVVVLITAIIVFFNFVKPKRKFHSKKSEEDEDN